MIADSAISDDGSRVVVGTTDGHAIIYDNMGTLLWKTQVPGHILVGCQGNGDGFIVASRDDLVTNKGAVRYYDQTGAERWYVSTGAIEALDLPATIDRLVIGNRNGETIVLDIMGEEIARFEEEPNNPIIADLSVADNGREFVYSVFESSPQVRYVTIDTKKKIKFKSSFPGQITGLGGYPIIRQVELSSDGKYIATASGEGSQGILTLHAKNGTLLWSKKMDAIRDIAISRNGSFVFAGTCGGTLSCYTQAGSLSWMYPVIGEVTSLSLTPEKELLAAGDAEGDIYLFNATGSLFFTLLWTDHISEFPSSEISQVTLARNGTALLVTVNQKSLYYFKKESDFLSLNEALPSPTQIPPSVTSHENGFFFIPRLVGIWNAWKNLTAPLWQQ